MVIRLKIDDLFFELFPELKNDKDRLQEKLNEFYSIASDKIEIDEENNEITITILEAESENEKQIQGLVSLCENGKFNQALEVGEELKQKIPQHSEIHRILGQIHSELGNPEAAINELIDALKWNPQNNYALLMMGNIYSQFKDDIETALVYYNSILKTDPDDYLTLNNVGAVLMQKGKASEAISFFNKALESNSEYPNTYLGLGLINMEKGNPQNAFKYSLDAISYCKKKDSVYNQAFKLAIESTQETNNSIDSDKYIKNFKGRLESASNTNIKIETDESIPTAAKIEFAENYNREFHLIKYKPSHETYSHLVLHELYHLELVLEARSENKNQLFTTNDSSRSKFFHEVSKDIKKLEKKGVPEDSVKKYYSALFDGLNGQIYNTPIDLFIEDRIYQNFPEFRPVQFLSLLRLLKEGINAVTQKEYTKNAPRSVIRTSKILNLVNAIHFRDLFKIDLTEDFDASKTELREAKDFYQEFLEYRDDKEPAEEYEIVQHWGEDLNLDSYFDLVPEDENKRTSIDSVVDEINKDPFGLEKENPSQERKMKKFLEEHSSGDTNLAVSMYMADAINYFNGKSKEEIKKIAFEFATLGMGGIDPKKGGYSVPSIKDSSFSGYKTLAYYYVSWALGIPEMLSSLQMPFDEEYDLANRFLSNR